MGSQASRGQCGTIWGSTPAVPKDCIQSLHSKTRASLLHVMLRNLPHVHRKVTCPLVCFLPSNDSCQALARGARRQATDLDLWAVFCLLCPAPWSWCRMDLAPRLTEQQLSHPLACPQLSQHLCSLLKGTSVLCSLGASGLCPVISTFRPAVRSIWEPEGSGFSGCSTLCLLLTPPPNDPSLPQGLV